MTYDAHKERNYTRLYQLMKDWGAVRLLQSVWLAELRGPATEVRDFIRAALDGDDSVAVVELLPGTDWATYDFVGSPGVAWLQRNI